MAVAACTAYEPVSSGEIHTIDFERAEEVERRHALLAEHLLNTGDDGLLIQRPANFAWLTCGGENVRPGTCENVAAIFVARDARVVLTSSVDSGQIFDRQLNGLGFQIKERPWDESRDVLVQDLCRGRRLATDTHRDGLRLADRELADFRRVLGEREHLQLRTLGHAAAHAVEATARTCRQGETESEVAGQLAHRLLRHEMTPVRLQVMADGQGHRYRHWGYGTDQIERHCVLSVVARRHGLHVAVTRTVCFGQPPQTLFESHQLACLIEATGIFFSKPGWEIAETWQRVQRIYEKYGVPEEWRLADQGDVLGYEASEFPITPRGGYRLPTGAAIAWRPSVNAAAVGDTILVRDDGWEQLTATGEWPQLGVQAKGTTIDLPDILCREV
jgi:Xaa-Pro aminopeptidase